MKKNLFAIETAVTLILIGMLIIGIVLKEFVITWLSVGFIALGGLGILIYKIVCLVKVEIDEQKANSEQVDDKGKVSKLLNNTKQAWQFSSNGERIKCLLFIFTFLLCCIAFIVLCSYGYLDAALGVIFGGIGVIIVSIILMAVIEKMLYKKYLADLEKEERLSKQVNKEIVENDINNNAIAENVDSANAGNEITETEKLVIDNTSSTDEIAVNNKDNVIIENSEIAEKDINSANH